MPHAVVPEYFLGVDGGQTGTRALIADETGRVIGSGRGGPASPADGETGRRRFTTAIEASVSAAQAAAGMGSGTVFAAACMGFSGGPDNKDELARKLVPAQKYAITHDAWIALNGATRGGPGIVAIAGTGSLAFGKNASGVTARAGGWGFAFGDEGSAFDLTRQAMRAALRQEEGWGPPTALRAALLEATSARNMNDLLHRFYTDEFPRARVAALAELVEATALRGDAVAQELLGAAAQSVAVLTGAVRQQLFGEKEPVDVRYSGGVFRCRSILARFQMLVEIDSRTSVSAPAYSAAAGALLEAFRISGVKCTLKDEPWSGL
ncbi:MAG TPA: BadF/BadG/BcrA/BcrD ATPase family protein [Bryobacteraceae bacterium]|nr:BadF/BadG/BcrA/BcrD ATPase family protein [Bryobacteraceae bacterium]